MSDEMVQPQAVIETPSYGLADITVCVIFLSKPMYVNPLTMVTEAARKKVRHSSNRAQIVRILLPPASYPVPRGNYVYFTYDNTNIDICESKIGRTHPMYEKSQILYQA
jgi:hypothetical protein